MKIFLATLGSEIDTFSPIPTTIETFEVCCLKRPPLDEGDKNWAVAPQLLFAKLARKHGIEAVHGLCAFAMPAAVPEAALYESLRDEILNNLRAAMPVDAVIYHLHGAFVAQGYDDVEGDILERTREIVGTQAPVGALFDLHAHISESMVRNATVLVGLKEYPHVDYAERSREMFELIRQAATGQIKPVMSWFDCRMIGTIHTTREPMRSYVDRLHALEGEDGVLSISVSHGFPLADVPDMGASVIVVTDDVPEKGDALSRRLGYELFEMRDEVVSSYLTVEEGVSVAIEQAGHGKPVVIADPYDNPGGGAPSDMTFVLHELVRRGVRSAAVAYLWDPVAVSLAQQAGLGGTMSVSIGGKTPISGEPLDVRARVVCLREDFEQRGYGGDVLVPCGDCAAIEFDGIQVVLSAEREQPLSLDAFTGFGIDPAQQDILVVKSTQHFYADFAGVADTFVYVHPHARGTPASELFHIPFRRIRRPKWPFDADPFSAGA